MNKILSERVLRHTKDKSECPKTAKILRLLAGNPDISIATNRLYSSESKLAYQDCFFKKVLSLTVGDHMEFITSEWVSRNTDVKLNISLEGVDYRLIGYDYLGGLYFISGKKEQVYYAAAENIKPLTLNTTFLDFIKWVSGGYLPQIYSHTLSLVPYSLNVLSVGGKNEAYSFYPFLWSVESKNSFSSKVVNAIELISLRIKMMTQLNTLKKNQDKKS